MQVELKHTVTVSKRAWYLRFWAWLYDQNLEDVTFCKLFWGYIAAPIVLLLGCIAWPIMKVHDELDAYKHRPKKKKPVPVVRHEVKTVEPPKKKKPRKLWQQRALDKAEHLGTTLVFKVATINQELKPFWKVVCKGLVGVGMLLGAALLATVVYFTIQWWAVTMWILIAVGVGLAIAGGLYILLKAGFTWIAEQWKRTIPFWHRCDNALVALARFLRIDKLAHGVEKTLLGIGHTARWCYVAVKSNTCLKIEIKE